MKPTEAPGGHTERILKDRIAELEAACNWSEYEILWRVVEAAREWVEDWPHCDCANFAGKCYTCKFRDALRALDEQDNEYGDGGWAIEAGIL